MAEPRKLRRKVHHHRAPWVHTQPKQQDRYIHVIEILMLNGRWKPYATTEGPDFSIPATRRKMKRMRQENRLFHKAWEEGRMRIVTYEQAITRWPDMHEED